MAYHRFVSNRREHSENKDGYVYSEDDDTFTRGCTSYRIKDPDGKVGRPSLLLGGPPSLSKG